MASTIDSLKADICRAEANRDELRSDLQAHPERRGMAWYDDRCTALHVTYDRLNDLERSVTRLEGQDVADRAEYDAVSRAFDHAVEVETTCEEIFADWADTDTDTEYATTDDGFPEWAMVGGEWIRLRAQPARRTSVVADTA